MAEINQFSFCSLEDVKQWLKLDSDDDDGHLITWINTVSADCEKFCNRQFIARVRTENFEGDNTNVLILNHRPVSSIATIKLYDGATELEETDYHLDGETGMIILESLVFAKTFWEIEVQYTAGYTLADIPEDLRKSIIEGVVFRYQKQDKKRVGVLRQSLAEQSTDYATNTMTDEVTDVWKYYRAGNVG